MVWSTKVMWNADIFPVVYWRWFGQNQNAISQCVIKAKLGCLVDIKLFLIKKNFTKCFQLNNFQWWYPVIMIICWNVFFLQSYFIKFTWGKKWHHLQNSQCSKANFARFSCTLTFFPSQRSSNLKSNNFIQTVFFPSLPWLFIWAPRAPTVCTPAVPFYSENSLLLAA